MLYNKWQLFARVLFPATWVFPGFTCSACGGSKGGSTSTPTFNAQVVPGRFIGDWRGSSKIGFRFSVFGLFTWWFATSPRWRRIAPHLPLIAFPPLPHHAPIQERFQHHSARRLALLQAIRFRAARWSICQTEPPEIQMALRPAPSWLSRDVVSPSQRPRNIHIQVCRS